MEKPILGNKGLAFWDMITEAHSFSIAEFSILEDVCREIDLISIIEDQIDLSDLISKGSMGQDVAHPLLSELRQHRAIKANLIKQLRLPEQKEQASAHGVKMAQARWSQRGAA